MNELEVPVIISSTREIYTSGGIVQLAVSDGLTKMEYEYIKERTSDTLKSKQNGESGQEEKLLMVINI